MTSPHRFAAIDAWRGLCAVMVVVYHFGLNSHIRDFSLILEAWRFVDFFFVLSGFIISFAYSHRMKSPSDVTTFAKRRFFRLWPLHAVILIGMVTAEIVRLTVTGEGFSGKTSANSILPNLLLIHSWGFMPDTSWNGPSWSISVEIVAYAAFAGIFLFFGRKPYVIAALVSVMSASVMIWLAPDGMRSDNEFAIFRGLYGFMAGVLVFRVWQDAPFTSKIPTFFEILCITIVILLISNLTEGPFEAILIPAFAFLVYVFASSAGRISHFLESNIFQFVGERSYSIYMIHAPLWYLVLLLSDRMGWTVMSGNVKIMWTPQWAGSLLLIAGVLLILGLADVAYRLVESRGRRWGDLHLRRQKPESG